MKISGIGDNKRIRYLKKTVICVLILGSFSIGTVPAYSGESISQQVGRVLPYIKFLKGAKLPVYLVLGVSNGEDDLEERFDKSYLFLDINHDNPKDKRSFVLDFNNVDELTLLSDMLNSVFDKIILDNGVFYYTKWSGKHLNSFKRMLKPGGEFIFTPTYNGYYPSSQKKTFKDIKLAAEREIKLAQEDGVLVVPDFYFSKSWLYEFKNYLTPVEIKERRISESKLLSIFRHYAEDDVPKYILSLGWFPEDHPASLCAFVIFYEIYITYYVRVLKDVFGDENVKITEKGTLPFKHHYTGRLRILITATRSSKL